LGDPSHSGKKHAPHHHCRLDDYCARRTDFGCHQERGARYCTKFDQSGREIKYNCAKNPTMQDEIAAQEKIKANQPPKPTTQQCQMVNGNLVCK
jgi:hypothetical protein